MFCNALKKVYLEHVRLKDIKLMQIITYFLSLLIQRLTTFVIRICAKISISTWKMKLSKIGVETVILSTKHKVLSHFVVNLTTLLLFHRLEPTKPLVTKLEKRNQDIYQAYCMID